MTTETISVRKDGITVLSETHKDVAYVADLVFIHGIQGHPRRTWTFSKNSRSKSKAVDIYWPKDLLCNDFSDIRVLTYGYDSYVTNFLAGTNQSGIFGHGQKFLRALKRERLESPKRPLIFLAHSLGGIITKETLRQAQDSKDEVENDVLSSTHAVIFFGTPHRGSLIANNAQIVERAARILFTTNPRLLRNLSPDGEMLERVRMDFARMLDDRKFKVYSFQEAKTISGFGFLRGKVVENYSSSLDHCQETTEEINADHRAMCQFHGDTDEGYVQVKGVVSDYLKEITQKIDKKDAKVLKECLRSLYTPAMHQRRQEIQPPEPHTFEWIFAENGAGFTNWLLEDGCLLWIKGKPAAGKSTLLKYVYEHESTLRILRSRWKTNAATASYFFYHQAKNSKWKSFDGLLRSLLYEILQAVPQLFTCIADMYQAISSSSDSIWDGPELEKAITAIGKQKGVSGGICLFMDALDEYPGECKDIVRNLKQLLEKFSHGNYKLKVCASSRPLIEFEATLPQFPGFAQIAIHDWTVGDIRIIVSNWLTQANRGQMAQLCEEIVSSARGSFQWVKLVLKSLSPQLYHFEPEHELLESLDQLPKDLDPFYSHLLQSIPLGIQPKMRSILQLMFCNASRYQVLTLAEISLAITLKDRLPGWKITPPLTPTDDLKRCQELMISIDTCLSAFVEREERQRFWHTRKIPEWAHAPLTTTEYEFTMSGLRFSHKTARDFILDRLTSEFFDTNVRADNVLFGHIRLCKLYTLLTKVDHGLFYLLLDLSLDSSATSFDHFDTELVTLWGIHAREIEYLEYTISTGQTPKCHDTRDSRSIVERYLYTFVHNSSYQRAIEDASAAHVIESDSIQRVENFNTAISKNMGKEWFKQWAGQFYFGNLVEGWPVLQSPLAFAILNGLFIYARDFLDSNPLFPLNKQDPPLLFWAMASCDFITETAVQLWRDEAERCHRFVHYLLKMGADPSASFSIPFHQTQMDESQLFKRPLLAGVAEITLLHYPLGLILKTIIEDSSELRMAMLELICILVENGANKLNELLTNYWEQRIEPQDRTILHYLTFPLAYKRTDPSGYLEEFDPFTLPDEGRLLCRTIRTLLVHGADPNAVDCEGIDVLTSCMKSCPPDLIEYALKKGALISPSLLDKDGNTYGLLLDQNWRKPEFFTPEAREIVRKHMPHWKDIVEGETAEEAVEDDAVEDDAVEDDAVEDDAVEDDAVEDDAVEDDAVEDDAVEDGAVEDGAVEDDAVEDDVRDWRVTENENVRQDVKGKQVEQSKTHTHLEERT